MPHVPRLTARFHLVYDRQVCKGDRLDSGVVSSVAKSGGKPKAPLAAGPEAGSSYGAYASPERVHELSVLRDLYEGLLPPRQREVIAMKLDEDLSLAEMAERLGVSRQACEDALKRAKKALSQFERKLGLFRRLLHEGKCVGEAIAALSAMTRENWAESREIALKLLKSVRDGGEEQSGV